MRRKKIPLHLLMIRGTLGKQIVIRHTPWGVIIAKYPDMSKIKASPAQRSCRNLFKEAVLWAKQVIKDPVLKTAWQNKLRRPNGVYNEAIKHYVKKAKSNIAVEQPLMGKNTRIIHCNGTLCTSPSAAIRRKSRIKKSSRKYHKLTSLLVDIGLPKNYFGNNKKRTGACEIKQGKIRSMFSGSIAGSNLRIVSEKYSGVHLPDDCRAEVFSSRRS